MEEAAQNFVDEFGTPTSRRMLAFEYWEDRLNVHQRAWVLRQIPEKYDARIIITSAIRYVAENLLEFEEDGEVLVVKSFKGCPEYFVPPKRACLRSASPV